MLTLNDEKSRKKLEENRKEYECIKNMSREDLELAYFGSKSRIKEAIKYFDKYKQEVVIGRAKDEKLIKDYLLPSQFSKGLLEILQRYKGDNK